ncbi:hypothetical protein [Streptomyces sp. NPDC059215]|uniref:hypothetical protein n=1 Tax=Streptomyces sp. NPDC059215 TaxID=3346772 RepID=UPI0036C4F2D3
MASPSRRGLTKQVATTAIDTACRLLWLPSIRNEFADITDRSMNDQRTYHGFLTELLGASAACPVSRGAGRRPTGAKQGPQLVGGDRPRATNGLADVGRPSGTEAFDEVCEVVPQIPRIGRLQPNLLAAVRPPDLEVGNRAFRRPVLTLVRQQQDVDETSDTQADVHEDPDRTGPGNLHHGALEDLPEAQVLANPGPLGICHHERIIAPSSVRLSGTALPSLPGFWRAFREAVTRCSVTSDAFLHEFGGLTVNVSGPGISCARAPFELDPEPAWGEDDRFTEGAKQSGAICTRSASWSTAGSSWASTKRA